MMNPKRSGLPFVRHAALLLGAVTIVLLAAASYALPGRADPGALTPQAYLPLVMNNSSGGVPQQVVLVGAGDIASCSYDADTATAKLLADIPGTVFTLGDNVYPDGTAAQFADCYDPTWGTQLNRTRPSVGNHDYHTLGASAYFDYFGAAAGEPGKGYYSYDLGDWHIIVLNSECTDVGGCNVNSPQGQWLQADLAANPSVCTLAYWHKPLYASDAIHGNVSAVQDFWSLLYAAGADVVLNGHSHIYERFAPQDPNGNADSAHGIREFVVGTGGANLYDFGDIQPNSQVHQDSTHGVLKLTLRPTGYDWQFVPVAGGTFTDSGSASCVSAISAPLVWVEDGMTKVYQGDPPANDSTITLKSAKNEYEPFQIVVRAPSLNDLTNVNVTVYDLIGPGGARIPSEDITRYREHYVYVTEGSYSRNATTNVPLGPGWYPDALIPFTDPVTHKDLTGRLDAVPFDLKRGKNQPIWVDVYTPVGVPPGTYRGRATVTSDQGSQSVAINLEVWNFALPKTRSLRAFSHIREELQTTASHRELLNHGLNPEYIPRPDERFLIDNYGLSMVNVFRASGASYGNCEVTPPPSVADVLAATANHQPELYLYTTYADEVWACVDLFPDFLAWANVLRLGGSHPLIFTYPVNQLMGPDLNHTAADIWVVLPKHYGLVETNIRRLIDHPGTEVWSYNAMVQDGYSPKYTIDYPAIDARIMQGFINQSLGLTGTEFWRVDYWADDPWNSVEALRADSPGDGHMAYRGADVGLPNQIVAGMRMKWFREGSDDYEYIQILKNLGQEAFAMDTVRTVATDFHIWTQDKDVLYAARTQLGDRIDSLSSAAGGIPGGAVLPVTGGVPAARGGRGWFGNLRRYYR